MSNIPLNKEQNDVCRSSLLQITNDVTIRANTQIKNCHEKGGPYLILLNAALPIFLLSLFALLRDDTNIFFANATNFGYRLLEFNLGVAVYCTLQTHAHFVMHVLRLLNACSVFIFLAFFLLWFAELGVPVHTQSTTCIRMYPFSPCIKARQHNSHNNWFTEFINIRKKRLSHAELNC